MESIVAPIAGERTAHKQGTRDVFHRTADAEAIAVAANVRIVAAQVAVLVADRHTGVPRAVPSPLRAAHDPDCIFIRAAGACVGVLLQVPVTNPRVDALVLIDERPGAAIPHRAAHLILAKALLRVEFGHAERSVVLAGELVEGIRHSAHCRQLEESKTKGLQLVRCAVLKGLVEVRPN